MSAALRPSRGDTYNASGQKILIVEDDEGLAGLLAEEISEAGYTARSVASAEGCPSRFRAMRAGSCGKRCPPARGKRACSDNMGRNLHGFSDDALWLLQQYDFPGNVRELQNAVERAVTFCQGSRIKPEDLPARIRNGAKQKDLNYDFQQNFGNTGQRLPTLAEVEKNISVMFLKRQAATRRKQPIF